MRMYFIFSILVIHFQRLPTIFATLETGQEGIRRWTAIKNKMKAFFFFLLFLFPRHGTCLFLRLLQTMVWRVVIHIPEFIISRILSFWYSQRLLMKYKNGKYVKKWTVDDDNSIWLERNVLFHLFIYSFFTPKALDSMLYLAFFTARKGEH